MLTRFLLLLALLASPLCAADSLKDYPIEYRKALAEMAKAFNDRDFERTLVAIDKADQIVPPTVHTLNTRAAIMIERHQWDEGIKLCRQALKIDPRYYPSRFNLAEIPLMQSKYAEARELFQKMLDENPRDELVQFRVFLTYLLEKNDTAAREALGKIKFPSDTPAYYYANAAWEFAHANESEGAAWVARGDWIFGYDKIVNFSESLVQLGWIERPVRGESDKAVLKPRASVEPTKAAEEKPGALGAAKPGDAAK